MVQSKTRGRGGFTAGLTRAGGQICTCMRETRPNMDGILRLRRMAALVRRAQRWDRIFRDCTNPLDLYDDVDFHHRYRFTRQTPDRRNTGRSATGNARTTVWPNSHTQNSAGTSLLCNWPFLAGPGRFTWNEYRKCLQGYPSGFASNSMSKRQFYYFSNRRELCNSEKCILWERTLSPCHRCHRL